MDIWRLFSGHTAWKPYGSVGSFVEFCMALGKILLTGSVAIYLNENYS